jgi:hypothetical protein
MGVGAATSGCLSIDPETDAASEGVNSNWPRTHPHAGSVRNRTTGVESVRERRKLCPIRQGVSICTMPRTSASSASSRYLSACAVAFARSLPGYVRSLPDLHPSVLLGTGGRGPVGARRCRRGDVNPFAEA